MITVSCGKNRKTIMVFIHHNQWYTGKPLLNCDLSMIALGKHTFNRNSYIDILTKLSAIT